MADKSKQTSDSAQGGGAAVGEFSKAPKDRRQNGFHSGGKSGESAGSSRGKQGNG